MWFLTFIAALVIDAVLIQVFGVWLKSIHITNHVVGTELNRIVSMLSKRARLILMRRQGVMREADCAIQHLNPSCRSAAHFPGLPVSRLLLSVNDADVATLRKPRIELSKPAEIPGVILHQISSSSIFIVFTFFSHIPHSVYAACLDSFSAVVVLGSIYAVYLLSVVSLVALLVVLGLVLLLIILYTHREAIWKLIYRDVAREEYRRRVETFENIDNVMRISKQERMDAVMAALYEKKKKNALMGTITSLRRGR